jgi:cytochrome c551
VLATVLTGCGSNGHHDHQDRGRHDGGMMSGGQGTMPMGSPMTATRAGTTAPTGGQGTNGQQLFLSSGCGSCHTLAAAGTAGTAGPNLDQAHPGYKLVIRRVTGGGGGTPAFASSLTAAQIRAIARYVAVSTSLPRSCGASTCSTSSGDPAVRVPAVKAANPADSLPASA